MANHTQQLEQFIGKSETVFKEREKTIQNFKNVPEKINAAGGTSRFFAQMSPEDAAKIAKANEQSRMELDNAITELGKRKNELIAGNQLENEVSASFAPGYSKSAGEPERQ